MSDWGELKVERGDLTTDSKEERFGILGMCNEDF